MNALQTVRLVRRASAEVKTWGVQTYGHVADLCPQFVLDRGETVKDWTVAVAALARPGETPEAAADRLATYMTLHADRYHSTPTLRRLDADWQMATTHLN